MIANASWVSKLPGRCGGDACVRDLRLPVWVIANYRRLGASDDDILKAYPSLNSADLEVAFEYAAAHQDEIDRSIRENEQDDEADVG